MSAEIWDNLYKDSKQMSRWPWSDLISLLYRYKKEFQDGHVLEVGCGAGANIPFFVSENINYHGIDQSPTIIQDLKERYPNLAPNLSTQDMANMDPSLKFNLIFDRAALVHNNLEAIKKSIDLIWRNLNPGSLFIFCHWFASDSGYLPWGEKITEGEETYRSFSTGPFQGLGTVHFFSFNELKQLFKDFEILEMGKVIYQDYDINNPELLPINHSMWNGVVRRPYAH